MNRMLKTIPAALLTAACAVALTACGGPSPEEAATAAVTETLDAYKNREGETWEEFVAKAESQESTADLIALGVDPEEVLDTLLDGFDYEINGTTVDDDAATVDVTLTTKQLSSVGEEDVQAAYAEILSNPDLLSMSEEELQKEGVDLVMGLIEDAQVGDTDVEIECTKDGDTWVIDEDSFGDQLEEAMFG